MVFLLCCFNYVLTISGALLLSLPANVLTNIFSHVVPADSILLGLTCKTLYSIHRRFHGPIKLTAFSAHSVHGRRIPLYRLLKDWWAPNWVLDKGMRLVKRDIWEKEEKDRLKLISEYVVARKRERGESSWGSSEGNEYGGSVGAYNLRKRSKIKKTFKGKSKALDPCRYD
jgi:hypothetical protein